MNAIPCKRPKVTVDPREPAHGTFDVNCRVPGCAWTYPSDKQFMALKSDAEEQATRHRAEHRAAVPKSRVYRLPAGPNYTHRGYMAECDCGWYREAPGVTTQADNAAALEYHLSVDHGLVTCS